MSQSVVAAGFSFYHMSLTRQNSSDLLRVYIDSDESISIADCVKVDKQIKLNLVNHDYNPADFSMEVSSPGLNRSLYSPEHYKKVIGKKIKVKYSDGVANNTKIGLLTSVEQDSITVKLDDSEALAIKFENVLKSSVYLEVK